MILDAVQLKKLADISSDMGQVAVASVVIPAFLDKPNLLLALLGVGAAVNFWALSLYLLKPKS